MSLLESVAYHAIVFALLISLNRFLIHHPTAVLSRTFDHTQVIYYDASDYLPPIDTRKQPAAEPAKADPEYARQPIISVPPEADNRSQTIVTPPKIRLRQDVAMPNIIAWSEKMEQPRLAIPPVPLAPAAERTRMAPQMDNSVVAPPPDANRVSRRTEPNLQAEVVAPPPDLRTSRRATAFDAPQPAVVAPPPSVTNAPTRLGELNIGRTDVIAPAPQLAVSAQRAIPGGRSSSGTSMVPQVVPPPPSASAGSGQSFGSSGRVIALNLHPDVGAPPVAPPGNRRGTFAATPEGHSGASGAPGSPAGTASSGSGHGSSSASNGTGSNGKSKSDLPAGLYVGSPAAAKTAPVTGDPSKTTVASASPSPAAPRTTGPPARTASPDSAAKLSEAERSVFGDRKFYSLTLNMPNLNSAGGSWVIRFTELKEDANAPPANLSQPVATRKVDPGYPLQLMRENVTGTVILYAVIHADGSVGNVRVLSGVDERLDKFASDAVAQWKFEPATKNGAPVEVEATFKIPFRPPRVGSNF